MRGSMIFFFHDTLIFHSNAEIFAAETQRHREFLVETTNKHEWARIKEMENLPQRHGGHGGKMGRERFGNHE